MKVETKLNPDSERKILIAHNGGECDGCIYIATGWFDIYEDDYYFHDGEPVDVNEFLGWCENPEFEIDL